jgi:hypothetical protein
MLRVAHDRYKLIVVALALLSAGYFHGGAASNQNARLDAAFSFVEPGASQGTFRIDRFLISPERDINTADWAKVSGHYYANKAPLSIVLSTAAYAGVYAVERALGLHPQAPRLQLLNSYLINLFVSVSALGMLALSTFKLLRETLQPPAAAALSLALCLGTGLFPYATQLWGHTTAAAFVLAGVLQLRARAPMTAGLWLGAAVATDYLTLLAAAGLTLTQRPRAWPRMAAGAVGPLALMLGYHWYCFGSPFTLATTYSNPRYTDARRVLGMFAGPDLHALWQLTLSPFRGVLVQMPILCLAPLGFVHWWRREPRDPWLWGCLLSELTGLLAAASFNGWHGGATVCARYLLPFVPLLFVAFGQIAWSRWSTAAAIVLGALSVVNMLAVAAVNPLCPDAHANPLYGYTYAKLWAGEVAPYAFPVRLLQLHAEWPALREHAMWNWGELLGLRRLGSLLPLLAAWIAGALWLATSAREPELQRLIPRQTPASRARRPRSQGP